MSKMEHIHDTTSDRAIDLPKGVHVVAQPAMLAGLDGLDGQVTAIASGLEDPLPTAQLSGASMIIVEVDPASRNTLERVDRLRSEFPMVPIIAGLGQVDIATSRQLLRRGVSDIVALPFTLDELVTSIVDTAEQIAASGADETKLSPFVAVIKSIGGAGSTTIATHLAAQMVHDMGEGKRACVIDLDLQAGDIASYLGCTPRLNLADLLEAGDRLDGDLVRSVTAQGHELVDVIAPPSDIVPVESVDFEQLMRIVNIVRHQYDLVLVDLPASFTNWSLSTVYAADLSLLVGTLTIPSLRHAKRQLDFLVSMGIPKDTVHVILNRVENRLFKAINSSDASEALKHPVFATVSEDGAVLQSAQDQGQLVYAIQKRSKFSKDIMHLSELLAQRIAEAE